MLVWPFRSCLSDIMKKHLLLEDITLFEQVEILDFGQYCCKGGKNIIVCITPHHLCLIFVNILGYFGQQLTLRG